MRRLCVSRESSAFEQICAHYFFGWGKLEQERENCYVTYPFHHQSLPRGYSGAILLQLCVLHTTIFSIINNMPPKPDLLYNETAAVVIMKYFSLVTQKILVEAVGKAFPFVPIRVQRYKSWGWGCSFFTHSLSEAVNGATNSTVHSFWSFSFQWQSLMKLAWPCVIPMYILWIHQSLSYPEHLSGVTGPSCAAWNDALGFSLGPI